MRQTTLVIHFNAFTGKLESGYLMQDGKKVSMMMLPSQVLDYMSRNPDARCDPLKV